MPGYPENYLLLVYGHFIMDDDGTLLRDKVRIRIVNGRGGVLPDPPEEEVAQTWPYHHRPIPTTAFGTIAWR